MRGLYSGSVLANAGLGRRLALGFGAVILLMLALTVTGVSRIGKINDGVAAMVTDIYPQTVMVNQVKFELNQIARSMRNQLLVTTAPELKAEADTIAASSQAIDDTLTKFGKQPLSAQSRQLLAEVNRMRGVYQPALGNFLKLVADMQVEQARDLTLPEIAPLQDNYFKALDKLVAYQAQLMEQSGKEASAVAVNARYSMILLAALAAGLALLVAVLVTRGITRPLKRAIQVAEAVAAGDLTAQIDAKGSDEAAQLLQALKAMNGGLTMTVGQVRSSADSIYVASREIAAGNLDLSQRTEQQAAGLEEAASSMEQLTSTVKQTDDNARLANEMVGAASRHALRGGTVVGRVVETMGAIRESSKRIADIIGVIDGIAFQTNILALNAAVEAARAGEQGRGFAVVASEVRNLAQRSAGAAREIKVLIGDSVEKISGGGLLVDEAGKTMADIVSSVQQVATIMAEISSASREQSAGIEQVNQAIAQMDYMTQQNAALVEQAAAAAQSMQQQTVRLGEAVAVFKLETPEAAVAAAVAAAARAGQAGGSRSVPLLNLVM
ncbi:methyl-accepting chemotaxis protein [Undibacterium sp.]|uniref:methyl-accepting chemotaxis protein n=1 Tax=Undibacterium sp. TaxID=1914977 RepID=UPI00374CAD82